MMKKVRLIGPEEEYELEWDDRVRRLPSIFFGAPDRVWVKATGSTNVEQKYFEQVGWEPVMLGRDSTIKRVR